MHARIGVILFDGRYAAYNETEYPPRCNSGYPAPSLARAVYQAIPGIVSGRVVAHATGIHAIGPPIPAGSNR